MCRKIIIHVIKKIYWFKITKIYKLNPRNNYIKIILLDFLLLPLEIFGKTMNERRPREPLTVWQPWSLQLGWPDLTVILIPEWSTRSGWNSALPPHGAEGWRHWVFRRLCQPELVRIMLLTINHKGWSDPLQPFD